MKFRGQEEHSWQEYSTQFELDTPERATIKRKMVRKRKSKKTVHGNVTTDFQIKRFRGDHKTYRVYCYEQRQLNIPYRFQKLLQQPQVDNDVETSDDQIQNKVSRGIQSLMEAARSQNA